MIDLYQVKYLMCSLCYAEACNELEGSNSASLRLGQHSSFWKSVAAVANCWQHCVQFDVGEIERQTSRSRDERVSARPTGRYNQYRWLYVVSRTLCVVLQDNISLQVSDLHLMI